MKKEKRLITSALPYVNNFPHIGNIVGSHLPADIYARYCRLAGYETVFIGGSDEHGTATEIAAEKEGLTPQELCDKYYKEHKKIYEWFQISYDNFSRTSKPIHHQITQEFFKKAYKNGYITEGILTLPFCENCKRQLSDRYIEGICPKCSYDKARGDQCEKCGNTLEPQELKEPRCAICKENNIHFKPTKHLFLALDKLSPRIKEWIINNNNLRPHVKNAALAWINEGLKPRCITRNLKWGVPVPLKGYEDLVFYVWYDAPIGYVSATMEWNKKKGKEYWTNPKNNIYHFLGKDNVIFHTIFWESSLLATGGYSLPHNVIGLEYLNYEGGKISKSQNWGTAVFCNKLPEYHLNLDYWRFYLTNLIPETKDTDFSWREFKERVIGDLIDNFGNFINRTLTFVNNKCQGTIKRPIALDETFNKKINEQIKKILENYEHIELRQTLAEILRLSSLGNEHFNAKEPWKTNDQAAIYQCTALCEILALLIQPFLPNTSKKILNTLNSTAKDYTHTIFKTKKYTINKPEILFDKKDFQEKIEHIIKKEETIEFTNKKVMIDKKIKELTFGIAEIKGFQVQTKSMELERVKKEWLKTLDYEQVKSTINSYEYLLGTRDQGIEGLSSENLWQYVKTKKQLPNINTVTDSYNLISLKTGMIMGIYDADKITGNLAVREATGNEHFIPIGNKEKVPIQPREYILVDEDNKVITRWLTKQHHDVKIEKTSKRAIVCVQGNKHLTKEHVQKVLKEVCAFVTQHCGGEYQILY